MQTINTLLALLCLSLCATTACLVLCLSRMYRDLTMLQRMLKALLKETAAEKGKS